MLLKYIKQPHKFHNVPVPHPTIYHSEQKCTFLLWMVYCGIWHKCIVEFARLVNWYCLQPFSLWKQSFHWKKKLCSYWIQVWWYCPITLAIAEAPTNILAIIDFNPSALRSCGSNINSISFGPILRINILKTSWEISLRWIPQNTFDDEP